ncbi:MAG: 2,3-cyclic 3-phosphodiesterase [Gaiellaceae bacterium]|nr:2,3-cyclic 3-phosphodiesterase [Gaiellaceae bacterium]
MKLPASVEGRDRARLFCALRLPEETLDTLSDWQADHIDRGRPVPRDHLHITLAFLGHRPVAELEPICRELREAAAAADPIRLLPERYRETRSVGMLALSDPEGGATRLQADLQGRLERLGVYEPEQRPWLPHVTVVRFRERPRLQPPLPALGEVCPSDAAAYHSVLRSGGAQYVVVESFALGG